MKKAYDRLLRDEKDRKIIHFLLLHPAAQVEEIARDLKYPQSTVQKRISRMLHDECLERVVRVVDWSAIGYPLHYWVDVKVRLYELRKGRTGSPGQQSFVDSPKKLAGYIMQVLPKAYGERLIVEDVIILLGSPADLSISIRAADHHVVLDFVTSALRNLGSVESTTTFHAAWSCVEGDLN